jgi:phosphonoacetaldehyde hydrolase
MITSLPIRLVVFDWAGTTVDHGCMAPVAAFVQAFADQGVHVSAAEARAPMGLAKRDHVRKLLENDAISQRWQIAHARAWDENDVSRLYERFIPLQMEVVDQHAELVPGLLECVKKLRARSIRIGATTGYFREAAARVYLAAKTQGYEPDVSLCAEDVPAGRPAPWMIYHIMEKLDVYPPSSVLKIGDTVPDIEEGLNAGTWSIGVTRTGSEIGLTRTDFEALDPEQRNQRLLGARNLLRAAGAHAVIDSLEELPDLVDRIKTGMLRLE